MPIPLLFLLGYSAVLSTYEVVKTSKATVSRRLSSDCHKYRRIKSIVEGLDEVSELNEKGK